MLRLEEVKNEYFLAVINQQNGSNESMKVFREKYPNEYKIINAMYHKRVKLKQDIDIMIDMSCNEVYFGTLTFDSSQDSKSERTKRQQALRHLANFFLLYDFVEEYGEERGRYHIHFVGVFRHGKTIPDFKEQWHSFVKIDRCYSKRKVARYICDYVVKQVPRIRRNKKLIECSKMYKKAHNIMPFESLADNYKACAWSLVASEDLPF